MGFHDFKHQNNERIFSVMNLFIKTLVPAIFGIGSLFSLYNGVQVQAVEVMYESSLLETSDLSRSSNVEVVEGILSVSKKEILAGKESADVIFYFQTNVDYDELMLYQNDVVIGSLVDSGNYAQDGDDIQGDGVYSMKFTIDVTSTSSRPTENEKVVFNVYNVRYGETIVSNEISIDIITPFTDQELDDISKVDEAVSQLTSSDEYTSMDTQQKIDAVIELLKSLEEEGIVNSIVLNGNQIEFLYTSGVQGLVLIDSFDENIDGPVTTTPINDVVTTTSTETTVITIQTSTQNTETTPTNTSITAETIISDSDTESSDTSSTESYTTTTTTTGTEATLPQTGYSKWYQALIAAAMGVIGVGSAAIVKSGIFRKKENNS